MASLTGPSSSSSLGGRSPTAPPPAPQPTVTAKSTTDPVLRNALRYTISTREYAALHKYVISRSRALKRRAPTVDTVQRIMEGRARTQSIGGADKSRIKSKPRAGELDDYNARAIRHSLRVFMATGTLMKLWGFASARLMGGKLEYVYAGLALATWITLMG